MLFSLAFDSTCTFPFEKCLFEYQGREFVIHAGDEHYCETIETMVQKPEDRDEVFVLIHEFLYLFGWQHRCSFHFMGGSSMSASKGNLLEKKPSYRHPRGFRNLLVSFDTMTDPTVSQDFKNALSLYNDAQYTNDIFYKFFCLYKILDLPVKGNTRKPQEWVNANLEEILRREGGSIKAYLGEIDNAGEFFRDQCRNAISHIHRGDPAKKSVMSYLPDDHGKIAKACTMIQPFVKYFIRNVIGEPQYGVRINKITEYPCDKS